MERSEGKGMINWMSLASPYKEPRRVRVYVFSAELLFHILSDGEDNVGLYGWPKGAEILQTHFDPLTGEMSVVLEHMDFSEVEHRGLIPAIILKPTVLKKSCVLCRFCTLANSKLVCFNDSVPASEVHVDFWCNQYQEHKEGELEA